jgi:ADP-ribosylglycohydrolase
LETLSRARGALYGLAIGDALGMPTQMLSRAEIRGRWGPLLTGFEPAPPGHPIAAGLPAGTVTDDTEQAVLLGRLLVKGHGTIDPNELATALVSWERAMAERGSLDLLGPSTKRAVAAVLVGVPPQEAGSAGATRLVAGQAEAEAAELIYALVGTSLATQESVPAAFAVLAAVPADPWRACLLAASLGGDCDTIAAMAGAMAGACHGVGSFPAEAIAVIDGQGLGLAELADDLLTLRAGPR